MLLMLAADAVRLPEGLTAAEEAALAARLEAAAVAWLRAGVRLTAAEHALLTPRERAALARAADRLDVVAAVRVGLAAQGLHAAAEVLAAADGGRAAAGVVAVQERTAVEAAADRIAASAAAMGAVS